MAALATRPPARAPTSARPSPTRPTAIARNWDTTRRHGRPATARDFIRAVITDNAGNVDDDGRVAGDGRQHGARRRAGADRAAGRRGQPDHELDGGARRHRHQPLRRAARRRRHRQRGRRPGASRSATRTRPTSRRSSYTVRAYDAAGNFAASNADSVLRRLDRRQRAPRAHRGDADRVRARAHAGRRRRRSPSTTTTSTATACCSARRRRRPDLHGRHGRPRARTTTRCSPATRPPSPACSRPRSRSSTTSRRRRAAARRARRSSPPAASRSPGPPPPMRSRASPATSCAARPARTPPAAADGGTAVCAPAATELPRRRGRPRPLVVQLLRPRRRRQRRARSARSASVNDHRPRRRRSRRPSSRSRARRRRRPRRRIAVTLHWVKPTAADLARIVVVLNLKHAPKSPAGRQGRLQGPRHVRQGQAARGPERLLRGLRVRPAATTSRPSRRASSSSSRR